MSPIVNLPAPTPLSIMTPQPFATPQPTPSSERELLRTELIAAGQHARSTEGVLGAVVIDLGSGAVGELNGDVSLPMESAQNLLIAIVAYQMVDHGTLSLDTVAPSLDAMLVDGDGKAATSLIREIGGIDALNTAIRNMGYDKIVAGANDDGVATPVELGKVLTDLIDGHLIRSTSRAALMNTLSAVQTSPGRLRAGLPDHARLAHATGTSPTVDGVTAATNDIGVVSVQGKTLIVVAMLNGAKGTDSDRDAILASVARAAVDAATH